MLQRERPIPIQVGIDWGNGACCLSSDSLGIGASANSRSRRVGFQPNRMGHKDLSRDGTATMMPARCEWVRDRERSRPNG